MQTKTLIVGGLLAAVLYEIWSNNTVSASDTGGDAGGILPLPDVPPSSLIETPPFLSPTPANIGAGACAGSFSDQTWGVASLLRRSGAVMPKPGCGCAR